MLVPLTVDGEHVGFYAIYHDITELQRARERAETLFAVTQVLGKTLSLEETFEAILDELQRVVPYDSCSIQVIQGNRLVIVSGRGLDDLGGLLGAGFDLDDETNLSVQVVRSKRQQVFADVSQNPHFASDGARRRAHSRMDLCADDRRRPGRSASISVDKFEAGLLRRRAGGARDGIRRPGRDGDRECPAARHRARRPRTGRDAPRSSPVARQHARCAPRYSI